jgi:hypothetical protein
MPTINILCFLLQTDFIDCSYHYHTIKVKAKQAFSGGCLRSGKGMGKPNCGDTPPHEDPKTGNGRKRLPSPGADAYILLFCGEQAGNKNKERRSQRMKGKNNEQHYE